MTLLSLFAALHCVASCVLVAASNDQQIPHDGVDAAKVAESDVVVDDMIYSSQQYLHNYFNLSGFGGAGMTDAKWRWPKGIIPYTIGSEYSAGRKRMIQGAMQEWMDKTCIIFAEKGSPKANEAGHPYAINIGSHSGCYSYVGYQGHDHPVSLQLGSCTHHRIALHELGHTIGLHHEQCRPDRDNYVKVVYENVPAVRKFNFDKVMGTSNYGIPYDYCSIMHYGNMAYSPDNKYTVLTVDPEFQFRIGESQHLAFSDAKVINLMYECNEKCPKNPSCKDECYVNHKCQCECPTKCDPLPCGDFNAYCKKNAAKGLCERNYRSMKKSCPLTCGHCKDIEELRRKLGI